MRRWVLAAFALLLAVPASAQLAERPVRIIVPFPPGGSTDLIARVVAEAATPFTPRGFVLENRGGAGGNIGVTAAARAAADGYTLLVTSAGFVINAGLFRNPGYDPIRDFTALTELGASPDVFLARAESPIRRLDELVERARTTAGGMHFTNPGTGSTPHLAAERLSIIKNISFLQVANSSAALAVQALLAGNTEIGATALASSHSQIKAGRLRALALTGPERWFDLPDVPTMLELGYPDFVTETFHGLFTPAGTPDAINARLAREAMAVMSQPETLARMQAAGFVVRPNGPQALASRVSREVTMWRELIARAGIAQE